MMVCDKARQYYYGNDKRTYLYKHEVIYANTR